MWVFGASLTNKVCDSSIPRRTTTRTVNFEAECSEIDPQNNSYRANQSKVERIRDVAALNARIDTLVKAGEATA